MRRILLLVVLAVNIAPAPAPVLAQESTVAPAAAPAVPAPALPQETTVAPAAPAPPQESTVAPAPAPAVPAPVVAPESMVTPVPAPVLAQENMVAPEPGSEPDFIFIQELKMWEALQSHSLATFQSLLMPDFIDVERTIQTRDQILENLNTCTLVSFHFHNHQTWMFSPDAAVIAYTADTEVVCGESHLKGSYNATTTWVRRDGKWMVQIHTENPVRR
jgi:Domain of unknown function (DUF4440)